MSCLNISSVKKCLIKYIGSLGSKAKQIVLNVCDYFLKNVKSRKIHSFTYRSYGKGYIALVSVVGLYIEPGRNQRLVSNLLITVMAP